MLKKLYELLNANHRDFNAFIDLIRTEPESVKNALTHESDDCRPSDTLLGLAVSSPTIVQWLLDNDAKIITKEKHLPGCWPTLLIIPTVTAERSWEKKYRADIDASLKILCNHPRMASKDKELALTYLNYKITEFRDDNFLDPNHKDYYRELLCTHKQIIESSLLLQKDEVQESSVRFGM